MFGFIFDVSIEPSSQSSGDGRDGGTIGTACAPIAQAWESPPFPQHYEAVLPIVIFLIEYADG